VRPCGAVVGVGLDVVEVARVHRAARRWGERLLRRLFTEAELARARGAHAQARLAARFAAKEAVMKALGVGWQAVRWREIEIRTDPTGRPTVVLSGEARALAERLGVGEVLVSLSHTDHLAAAQAVALARSAPTP